MALNSRKIRLPELAIFRRFSLALRQEFARPEDVIEALEESRRQINELIDEAAGRALSPLRSRRPELFGGRRLPDASGDQEGSDDEEPAESFLKESVGRTERSPEAAQVARVRAPRTDVTRPMSLKEVRAAIERPERFRVGGTDAAEDPETGKDEAPKSRKKSSRKARPPKSAKTRSPKRPTSRPSASPAASGPGDKAASPGDEPEPKEPPAEVVERKPAAVTKSGGGRLGKKNVPAAVSDEDEDPDFWGDDRWTKGRKGKSRADKGRDPVGIVRIGAEGRPVEKKGAADDGA